jgi:ATP-binding cassette, subfamily B, multidrug efflux pump
MKSLRSLWPYMRPYRRQLMLGLAVVVVASALPNVVIWILGQAIDGITHGVPVRHTFVLGALMVAAAVVGGAFRYEMRELLNGLSRYVEYDLRNDLFVQLERLDAAYFARTRTGDIMARLTNDLSAVRMAAGPAVMYLVATIAGGLIAVGFMLHTSPRVTGLALLPMVVVPVIMVRLGRAIHDRFEAVQEHFSTLTSHAQENLSGTRIVRAYRQERAELGRFAALNDEYLDRNMRLAYLYGAMNPVFALLAGAGAVVVLGVGGTLVTLSDNGHALQALHALRGTISLGEFVAFGLYLGILTWPLIALGWVINLFERGAASMSRLNEILDARSQVVDAAPPRALPALASGVEGRTIEFRGVGFHYPVTDGHPVRWVLRDVSFTVPAGATLGIVGATGSGKSALVDLIPRIYDPQEGEIVIDGVPIRNVSLSALRHTIGMVPQDSLLFSDTIGANLAYGHVDGRDDEPAGGRPDGPDDAGGPISSTGVQGDARWAAGIAQLDETVSEFPGGYHTMLGERGINLSGGQKQRAALARALARRPSIVLLDDALSAVDTHTEAEILRGLREALSGRTAIIASHRISAIRDATWIVVLDQGRVVEQGRHDELLAVGGRYWALLRRQQLVDDIERDVA